MPEHEITKDYFLKEFVEFRKIMCSRKYTIEDKLKAYKALWFIYLNLKSDISTDDEELCKDAMNALDIEFNMRIGYQQQEDILDIIKAEVGAITKE